MVVSNSTIDKFILFDRETIPNRNYVFSNTSVRFFLEIADDLDEKCEVMKSLQVAGNTSTTIGGAMMIGGVISSMAGHDNLSEGLVNSGVNFLLSVLRLLRLLRSVTLAAEPFKNWHGGMRPLLQYKFEIEEKI